MEEFAAGEDGQLDLPGMDDDGAALDSRDDMISGWWLGSGGRPG